MAFDELGTQAAAVAFGGVAQDLHAAADLDELLVRAVAFAGSELAGDCAGLVVWPGRGVDQRRAVGSDWRFDAADEVERVVGEGPGQVSVGAEVVTVDDTTTGERWARWGPRVAARFGIRSVLCVPLTTTRGPLGVLSLYSTQPQPFTKLDRSRANLMAVHTAMAVATVVTAGNLRRAMDAHTQIGQAVGLLMERFGIDADEAVALLRRESQDHNVSMRSVAASLLAERTLPRRAGQSLPGRRRVSLDSGVPDGQQWRGDVTAGSRPSQPRRAGRRLRR